MRDKDYTVSSDFLKRVFGDTLHKVELRACHNAREREFRSVFTRDAADIEAYCTKNDEDGVGTYFGVCTRGDLRKDNGSISGAADNVMECPALWVDIDCAKQGIRGDDARQALAYLPFPPCIVVNSGGGLHAYWIFEEPVDVTPGSSGREAVEDALRALVGVLAGDRAVAEIARILRLPGTHNSKSAVKLLNGGDAALCEVEDDTQRVYDAAELFDWLREQRAVLHAAVREPVRAVREDDPFLKYAREAGYEPAIDIDAALAAMEHGGLEDRSIHRTQIRVTYSMIARGYSDDEIVDRILAATEAAAPRDQKWNWAREEKELRRDIAKSRPKQAREREAAPRATMPLRTEGNVAVLAEKRQQAKPEPKARREKTDEITALGTAVIGTWQERYGPLIHSQGTTYVYEAGVWSMWDERHDQMLRTLMQEGCEALGITPKSSLISSASAFFSNRPALFERDAAFDDHGLIIAGDGTIDPRSGDVGEHSPDHRAMFKVQANLHGRRDCPAFLQFLSDAFTDKPAHEVPEIIRTIQEWFGACLVTNKPRALAKGMLVHGGSRTGKTQLSEILRALLGKGKTSATSVGDIGSDFGLQGFVGMRGWVADDAIGQGEALDAERYKKIVTGEEIGVRRKNRTDVQVRFGFPVMITANHLPRIKDQSDAVYNRSLILQMTHVRSEDAPEPIGYNSIAAKIVAEELSGVLWWAIEGWQRLSARGVYTEPPCMKKAVKELQKNNNSVRTWLEECAAEEPAFKVANADLFASFAGWYYQENGDGKFPWSQNGFIRALKELLPNLGYQKGAKTRNLTGIMLNEDGKEYWSINSARDGISVPKPAALDVAYVNQDYSPAHAERAVASLPEDRRPRF